MESSIDLYVCLYVILHYLDSVQFSHSVMSNSLQPHELQHTRPPCPSQTPGVYPNPCPSSQWCHPTISSSVVSFSSCPQSFPASGSFPMSQFFISGGQSIGVSTSTSLLPMNTQPWSPLGWTGWISLQSKGLSRVFSNTTVQKHQFFGTQLSSQSNSLRSIQFLSFIVSIFAWNVSLVSLIFFKRSLAFPFYCFPLFLCIVHLISEKKYLLHSFRNYQLVHGPS